MFLPLIQLEQEAPSRFIAPQSPDKGPSVFGGQFLAQCLAATYETLERDRHVHSLHAYFLRPGDVNSKTSLRVETVRDGRSFSAREVSGFQNDVEVFRMIASFQIAEESPEYDGPRMPEVPPPDAVDTTYDGFTASITGEEEWYGMARRMDIRYINPPGEDRKPVTEPQLMWMRLADRLPDDPAAHYMGLAYLSDSTLIDHVLLPHGLRWQQHGNFMGTSIDHAMWFRRFARADEWLLFEQEVETTGAGRGLARGRFFDMAGRLIATCVQEGLMRWITT